MGTMTIGRHKRDTTFAGIYHFVAIRLQGITKQFFVVVGTFSLPYTSAVSKKL